MVAAGLVLPARLAGSGRSTGDRPLPATAPATGVAGAASIGGYWFGKAGWVKRLVGHASRV